MKAILGIMICLFLASPAYAADVNLAWDAAAGATSYELQVSTDLGVTWSAARDAGAGTTYTWTGAPDVGLILFRVSAKNAAASTTRYHAGAWYNGSWQPPVAPTGAGIQ